MKIAFTICSNNYLAQAKVLGDSLLKHNPDYNFIICLVDKKSDFLDYSFFNPHQIIPIEEVGISGFEDVWKKYNIIELNTAVKPSFIKYLFARFSEVSFLFYFDPDIMIFDRLNVLETGFNDAEILLTPHAFHPIEVDELWPSENTFLNFGIYNLGFIGVKRGAEGKKMLDWWEERTLKRGFFNPCEGVFVDQLWINLVPIYYKNVRLLDSLGYNVAPWNLHERKHIKFDNGKFIMLDQSVLTFYHFSSYDHKKPDQLSKAYNRHSFINCPDLKAVYTIYQQKLLINKIEEFSRVPCYYVEKRTELKKQSEEIGRLEQQRKGAERQVQLESTERELQSRLRNVIKEILPPFMWKLGKKTFGKT